MADAPWFAKHSGEIAEAFSGFYKAATEKNVLGKKTTGLIMTALSSVLRCPHCLRANIQHSLDAGATKQEVTEALLLAGVAGGGTQLFWAKEVYDELLGD